MPIARLAVVACALVTLAGCGATHPSEAAQTHTTRPAAERTASSVGYPDDEVRTPLGDGVVLVSSPPKTFTPSDTAYPRSRRAVAMDLDVDNGGDIPFRPSQLSFTATVDGAPTEQVIDSTQGYNGVSSAPEEIAPDQTLRITVAFAVPMQTCEVRISVRSVQPRTAAVELYDGVV